MVIVTLDLGSTWVQSELPAPAATYLTVDGSTNPSRVYDGPSERSVNGGMTWTQNTLPANNAGYGSFAVDPSGTLYLVANLTNQVFVSRDHAQTWSATGSFLPVWTSSLCCSPTIQSLVPVGSAGALYATTNQLATSGFVTKLSPDGLSIVFSTYLRGHASMECFVTYAAEPAAIWTQNSISGIALDAAGKRALRSAYVATRFITEGPQLAQQAPRRPFHRPKGPRWRRSPEGPPWLRKGFHSVCRNPTQTAFDFL